MSNNVLRFTTNSVKYEREIEVPNIENVKVKLTTDDISKMYEMGIARKIQATRSLTAEEAEVFGKLTFKERWEEMKENLNVLDRFEIIGIMYTELFTKLQTEQQKKIRSITKPQHPAMKK